MVHCTHSTRLVQDWYSGCVQYYNVNKWYGLLVQHMVVCSSVTLKRRVLQQYSPQCDSVLNSQRYRGHIKVINLGWQHLTQLTLLTWQLTSSIQADLWDVGQLFRLPCAAPLIMCCICFSSGGRGGFNKGNCSWWLPSAFLFFYKLTLVRGKFIPCHVNWYSQVIVPFSLHQHFWSYSGLNKSV